MTKYLSNRQKNLKIGITSYTESNTVLEVTGNVGIKTSDTQNYELYVVGDANITGIVSAGAYYGSRGNLEDIIASKIEGIEIQEEGVGIGTTFSSINFIGLGVTATANGNTANVTFTQQVGAQGTQGTTGSQGTDGAQGTTGSQGTDGPQGIQGISGDVSSWEVKTTTYTAVTGDQIVADTSGGSWTLTLPATPSTGNLVKIADGDDWNSNPLTIGRNGSTIDGYSDDFSLDIKGIIVELIYDGTTWEVFASVGPKGPQGPQGPQGTQGVQGLDGAFAAQGIQGTQGILGSQGIQGIQGLAVVNISNDTSATTHYPIFVEGEGVQATKIKNTSTAFSFQPSTGNLTVGGTVTCTDLNSTSDRTLKSNIETINNSIEILKQVNPVSFNWKENGKKSYGVIAQELEKVLPELISVNDLTNKKTVSYIPLIALLIDAVIELDKKIEN